MERQHLHTGIIVFVSVTVYAIVGVNLVRFVAAKLADNPSTETIGRTVGALVNWG